MAQHNRADFSYHIVDRPDLKLLCICDLDYGNISVTNDIVNVVLDIREYAQIDPWEFFVIYRDSTGRWDGWDVQGQYFFPVTTETLNMISRRLQQNITDVTTYIKYPI